MANFQELHKISQKREHKRKTYKQVMNELKENSLQENTRKINRASDEMLIKDIQFNGSAVVSALFSRYRNKIESLDMDNSKDLKKAFLLLADMALISNIASTESLRGPLKKQ